MSKSEKADDGDKVSKRRVKISASSGLDLAAELALAKEKFNQQRSKGTSTVLASSRGHPKPARTDSSSKEPRWLVKNKGVDTRNARDLKEQESQSSRSHQSLMEKANIYDDLKRSGGRGLTEDQQGLVDFELMDERSSEEEYEEASYDDSEMVETVDEFGRTRMVRKTLSKTNHPVVLPMDSTEHQPIIRGDVIQYGSFRPDEDAVKEIWDRDPDKIDYQELASHYDSNREIRTKGVGFYAFSSKESEREKEMKELSEIRAETQQQIKKLTQLNREHESRLDRRRQILELKKQQMRIM